MKKTCKRRFKSVPLDAAVTGPEELVQLKVVIALLISPINFSQCKKEWEHNRQNVLTLHGFHFFPHLLLTDVCMLSLSLNSLPHLISFPFMFSPLSSIKLKNVFVFCFSLQSEDSLNEK